MKIVYDIGIKDREYPAWKDGKSVKEYVAWCGMLYRCTQKYWDKYPTYIGTTCSNNFKHYSFFYEWCQSQIGFGQSDESGKLWHLDKDILVKGNNIYSEDTCIFVPQRINKLLIKSNSLRGDYPIGVSKNIGAATVRVRCSFDSVSKHLGCFETPQEAFSVYKAHKECVIKNVASEYKHQLDPRAYEALMNYTVEITD